MDAKTIDKATFDLSVKNPNGGEVVNHRSLQEIMDEIAALDAESAEVLAENPGAAVNGWETRNLSELCGTGAGGTPLKSHKEYYEGGNIPWLLSGEVCTGRDLKGNKLHYGRRA